ncbi:MAG TPA: L-lactate permease [Chthoniobacteraceae bacterium]|jgi:lactate permease|nr:L-lactate permease [Chthoniobacteraceae bacterium]
MLAWQQIYDPSHNLLLSCAIASTSIVVLLALLAIWHVRAHIAALVALGCSAAIAIFYYGMPPGLVAASATYGAAFGLFPIGWIVLNAIFIYEISVATNQFEALKHQVVGLADDQRLQALLIAFCFGAFIEGAAGFGAPVAISGALLIGLGFTPLRAAQLALIGNTAPVAFGSLGIPIDMLNKVTGIHLDLLSQMVGRLLPPFSFIVPFWLVAVHSGWRGMRQIWPACFVVGMSFAVTQFAVSNYFGPRLVDLASSLVSMGSLVLLLKFWKPKKDPGHQPEPLPPPSKIPGPRTHPLRPWIPWIALSCFVFLWSLGNLQPVKYALNNHFLTPEIPIRYLDGAVFEVPPIVTEPHARPAVFKLNWLSATGTALLLAGLVSGLALGISPSGLVRLYARTVMRVRISLLTIALMLALGYTASFSGSDITMGLAFAATGSWFPFFSPLLGWLGVALTGSDTSSNALFGHLQQVTAGQIGVPAILTTAANSAGGVMGKMIDAQSIVVASVAVAAREHRLSAGVILRSVFWHSLALAILVGLWVAAIAYWFPSLIVK